MHYVLTWKLGVDTFYTHTLSCFELINIYHKLMLTRQLHPGRQHLGVKILVS